MENNATYDYNSIEIVKYLIQEYFGEDVSDDRLAFVAKLAMDEIGNNYNTVFKYTAVVIKHQSQYLIPIPCNLEVIEAITLNNIDQYSHFNRGDKENYFLNYNYILPLIGNFGVTSSPIQYYSRHTKEFFAQGTLINYRFEQDRIIVDERYENSEVNVVYRGSIVDKDGVRMVTMREANAIAHYWNYLNEMKKVYTRKGGDGSALTLASQLKDRWIQRARVPERLSQNELNQIKDSLKKKNFGFYGISLKYGI